MKIAVLAMCSVFLSCSVFFSAVSIAEILAVDGAWVEVSQVTSSGPGCEPGTVVVTPSPGDRKAAILLNNFQARTDSESQIGDAECRLALQLRVAPGLMVGVTDIRWRGTVVVAPDALVNFHRRYDFSDSNSSTSNDFWATPEFQNFVLQDDPVFAHYSGCDGEPLTVEIEATAIAVGPNSLFSLRASDIEPQLELVLSVKPTDALTCL